MAPVAHTRYLEVADRHARADTLPAWQRVDVTAPTSRSAASTITRRAPSEHEDAATVYRSGARHSPLRYAAGRDQVLPTRRTLQSVAEGASRVPSHYRHLRGSEGALLLSGAFPVFGQHCSLSPLAPSPLADVSRTDHIARQRSTLEVARSETVDVASIAETVGTTMRNVYDISKKYISRFSSNVVSIVRELSMGLATPQSDAHRPCAPFTANAPPGFPDGGLRMTALPLSATQAPLTSPKPYGADPTHRMRSCGSAAPCAASVCGDLGAQGLQTRSQYTGLPSSPHTEGSPYMGPFPSVAAITPCIDGRSNPRGCDMSTKFESSPLSATKNTTKSTSQCTPALEGGAGVLQPKSHPVVMEGASAEDVLPAYAETSAPGKDSRVALESRTPYTTAKVPSEKHLQGVGPKDKSTFLNAATEQWAHNASPIAVHMFSRAAENPAAHVVLQSLQGGSQRVRSTPLPPQVTQPSAVSISSGRAGRVRSSAPAAGRDDESAYSKGLGTSRYERRARALRNAKLPMPTYDGCPDLRRYEEFVYKWDSWIRNKGLGESDSVELMYNALTGEALEWYLAFVAMSDHPWTSREIYQELYEYCFPSNFREELRLKLMTSQQDGRPIKQFAKDLQNLAQRFSDIGQSTLKRLLWDGVDPYIRVFWVEKGRSAEYDDYDTLVLYAHRAERREAEIRRCLDSEGAEVETELSPRRENNPDRGVTAHAVHMRQVALQSEEQPVPMEYEEPEYSEGEQEYYSEEEPGHGNNEEELVEAEGAYPQQFDDEYEEGEEEYYHSQDGYESGEHESQDPQGEYYEDEYEEYGEAEHQPDEYGDEDYPYLEGHKERNGEGEDYYDEEGEEEVYHYEDGYGDEDEGDGHNGEQPHNTGRNEYGEDEYESEGSLYED